MGGYVVFSVDRRGCTGMNKMSEEMGEHPTFWNTYFAVGAYRRRGGIMETCSKIC